MKEAKAGLEIADRVYPVRAVDRSRRGWVKVVVESVFPGRAPDLNLADRGVLAFVTPRGKLIEEPLGQLDHVLIDSDFEVELLFCFWFKQA